MRRLWKTRRRKLWLACLVAVLSYYLVAAATPQRRGGATWLPALPARTTATQTAPPLERAVESLSGRRVNVYCRSTADWTREARSWDSQRFGPLGPWRAFTDPRTGSVELGPDVCTELERLRGRSRPIRSYSDRRAAAWSVVALSHESVHVSGIADETKAECYGMQRGERAAVQLGLTPADGRYLARLYWRDWYPRASAEYRSADCRDGGRLDLHPALSRWP